MWLWLHPLEPCSRRSGTWPGGHGATCALPACYADCAELQLVDIMDIMRSWLSGDLIAGQPVSLQAGPPQAGRGRPVGGIRDSAGGRAASGAGDSLTHAGRFSRAGRLQPAQPAQPVCHTKGICSTDTLRPRNPHRRLCNPCAIIRQSVKSMPYCRRLLPPVRSCMAVSPCVWYL